MTADRFSRSITSALPVSRGGAPRQADRMLPISEIRPGEAQPRSYFDEVALERLAADIGERGILQPVLVRPVGTAYELVDGERRWRAAQLAGLQEVPAFIRTMTLEQARLAALSTALNREGLTPIEEARAKLSIAALELGIDDLEAARLELGRLSRPAADPGRAAQVDALFATLGGENLRSFAKNSLPLLNYPPELQAAMFDGLAPSKAKVIKNAPEALRAELLDMARSGATCAELTAVVKRATPTQQLSQAKVIGRFLASKQVNKLTPEQAEALATWLASAPEFLVT
ncbi:ParB/RepB/Spo0J family partition protein [Deinococcus sp. VB142]|uniref:ParB/RepB/Spo0J family partition protein n=1 Tax=Deinococcus sp. VB142 TaxID=3112952 RepID=A0AAU6Q466_9DEIO